jgi:hypothetical protein
MPIKVYHIIEETNDQQVVEIHAPSASEAVAIYLAHSTHEHWTSIERNGYNIIWNFPSEYCVMTTHTEYLVFAKWVHKKGLY